MSRRMCASFSRLRWPGGFASYRPQATSGRLLSSSSSKGGWRVTGMRDYPPHGGEPLWRVSVTTSQYFVSTRHPAETPQNRRLPGMTERMQLYRLVQTSRQPAGKAIEPLGYSREPPVLRVSAGLSAETKFARAAERWQSGSPPGAG